jgi:F0F1-type ATP synthase epsilon subunit
MKKLYFLTIALLITIVTSAGASFRASQPAFPGAEGFGANTIGGRGGTVFEVTNLNDTGTGSLRACVEASGARTCVFRVGGLITLNTQLTISNPYITIAGQTAPGGGITLKRAAGGNVFATQTHDVIIRYITARPGAGGENHANQIAKNGVELYNIIIDHNSLSWGVDSNIESWYRVVNMTIQWSLISEALDCSTHSKGCHSKGLLIGGYQGSEAGGTKGSENISVLNNLMAHDGERTPLFKMCGVGQVINNTTYNPFWTFAHQQLSCDGSYVNWVNNYHKKGPDSTSTTDLKIIPDDGGACYLGKTYMSGNYGAGTGGAWSYGYNGTCAGRTDIVVTTPAAAPVVNTTNATSAYNAVLADAGNSRGVDCNGNWYNRRDAIDVRIVNDVKNGTGKIIDNQSEVGGWITPAAGVACTDSDHDGMPDVWENSHGLNPNNNADGNYVAPSGYTWVEEYINGSTGVLSPTLIPSLTPTVTPSKTITPSVTPTPATVSPTQVLPTSTRTSVPTATSMATLPPATPTLPPATPITVPTGTKSVDVRVTNGRDDVEENSKGGMYINSTDLELVLENSIQTVGIRFANVNIPKGSTITKAYIQFKVDEATSSATTLKVQGEISANAPAFTSTTRNVSSRSKTTKVVNWSPSSWPKVGAVGQAQMTPNLAPIIQEIVNQSGWVPGNPIAIIITGSGKRVAKAYEGNAAGAPLLHIEYTTDMALAPLAMAAVVSKELPTALPTMAMPTPTLTMTSQPPSPTMPVTFTSTTVPPTPLLLPSPTPTSLAPVLPTSTPTIESINAMSVANEPPVITSNGMLSIAENTTAVATVTATDAGLPAQSMTYSISGGADAALFSINPSTGELTLITAPDFEVPTDAGIDNTYNVTVQASDGELTATQDIAVAVTALNDNNPVITSNGMLSIAENTVAVTTITATDADLPAQSLTYSISGGADAALFSINPSTGELTFITAPDFEVPTDAGIDNTYNLTVQASDGTLTATQDIAVAVTALNDNNPVITSNGMLSIAENTVAVTTITATDADLPAQSLTYSISGGTDAALFSINPSTGELTFITAPDFEVPTDAGIDNIYNVTVQASDGELTVTQDISVTVTAVNDNNPVITSNASLSIAENTTAVATVTATDADLPAQSMTYSISGGADAALFSINPSTGELTFVTAPDFEVPADAGIDNTYNLTIQASDGTLTATQDIAVAVTALNDNNPVITSNGMLSIAENTVAVTTITATDADLPAQSLTYSISGGADAALFSINPSTGELTFITAPDFEVPADVGIDNTYNLTVQASDGELTVTQDIAVTVTAVNDNNPVITSNASLSIAENTTAVATVTATDADLPAQSLTYSISGSADAALFSINPSTGELTFITAPDFEVPADTGNDNTYNVMVQASDGALTITQDIVVTAVQY